MGHELIEHVVARSRPGGAAHLVEVTKVRKLFGEAEGPERDALLDLCEMLTCSADIRLCWHHRKARSIAHALEVEIEAHAIAADGYYASS